MYGKEKMTKGKSHINEENFRRYLEDKMTDSERNAFEKELQKDAFETEAMEGYETVSLEDLQHDLQEIKEKIQPEKRKLPYRYFAAAATVLLVITAGIILIQFSHQNPLPKVTEKLEFENRESQDERMKSDDRSQKSGVRSRELEEKGPETDDRGRMTDDLNVKPEDEEIKKEAGSGQTEREIFSEEIPDIRNETVEDEINIQPLASIKQEIPSDRVIRAGRNQKPPPTESSGRAERKAVKNPALEADSNILDIGGVNYELQTKEVYSQNRTIRGKVISVDDNQPLPGVSIVEKGTQNEVVSDIDGSFELILLNDSSPTVVASFVGMESAEFQPSDDSVYQIEMEPSTVALNEVVAVGYESKKKKSLTRSVTRISRETGINTKAQPVDGMDEYNAYLEKSAILPDDYPRSKEIVKLLLKINHDGEIISIESRNNIDSAILDKAKELIQDGPDWSPEFKNGENIDSEVKLKIIFRKVNNY